MNTGPERKRKGSDIEEGSGPVPGQTNPAEDERSQGTRDVETDREEQPDDLRESA
jgi:hypothetical protein